MRCCPSTCALPSPWDARRAWLLVQAKGGKARRRPPGAAGAQGARESDCWLCAVEKLFFEPPPIYCTSCGRRIQRNKSYYSVSAGEQRHCFCNQVLRRLPRDVITVDGLPNIRKNRLEKRVNDEETEEAVSPLLALHGLLPPLPAKGGCWLCRVILCSVCWLGVPPASPCAVAGCARLWLCSGCSATSASTGCTRSAPCSTCGRNEGSTESTCPECCCEEMERGERRALPPDTVLGAKDLPRTRLSDHLEQRPAAPPGAGEGREGGQGPARA